MRKSPESRPSREDFVSALAETDTYLDISLEKLMDVNAKAEKHARLRSIGNNRVADVMSKSIVTIPADCSLSEAAHLLVTHRISGLPVVDRDSRLIGVITEADFLRALGVPTHPQAANLWQTLETLFAHPAAISEPDDTVEQLMVREVATVAPTEALNNVLDIMKHHRIKRVVVCDADRRVVGMVTRSDLIRAFFDRFTQTATTPR